MTIASKFNDNKMPEAQDSTPADKTETPATETEVHPKQVKAVVMIKSSPRRRRLHRQLSEVRSNSSFVFFIAALVLMDVYAIMTTDSRCPGPFTRLTGLHPTFNLYMMIALHLMTLIGGLSKTVNGCRLAMAVAWIIFLFSVMLLIFIPSLVGSYISSGLTQTRNITLLSESNAKQRFETGFYMAVGSQLGVFLIFICSIYQLALVGQLLAEAHVIETSTHTVEEKTAARGESASGVGEALLPTA